MTQKQKLERFDGLERESTRYMLAMNDLLNAVVVFSGWVREPNSDGKYRAGVSRLDSPAGGIVIVTYRHPGQGDHSSVYDLESFQAELRTSYASSWAGPIRDAITDAVNLSALVARKVA